MMDDSDREGYAMGYGPLITEAYATRRLADEAGFVIPLVHPGHRIIDCGCGPGSMTIDFAELAAAGEAVGVDVELSQIDFAKRAASDRNVSNVRFEVASVYDLPFADESFDLAYASAVLGNTREPEKVLREMCRVTMAGGNVCVRAFDLEESMLRTPGEPLIMECERLHLQLRREYGQDPGLGSRIEELLIGAGLVDIRVSKSTHEVESTALATFGKWMEKFLPQAWGAKYIELGWCSDEVVADMASAWARIGDCDGPAMAQVWYSASATRP